MRGRSVGAVTIMLYNGWLHGFDTVQDDIPKEGCVAAKTAQPSLACFAIGRKFVRRNASGPHDMTSIRESIAAGGTE